MTRYAIVEFVGGAWNIPGPMNPTRGFGTEYEARAAIQQFLDRKWGPDQTSRRLDSKRLRVVTIALPDSRPAEKE